MKKRLVIHVPIAVGIALLYYLWRAIGVNEGFELIFVRFLNPLVVAGFIYFFVGLILSPTDKQFFDLPGLGYANFLFFRREKKHEELPSPEGLKKGMGEDSEELPLRYQYLKTSHYFFVGSIFLGIGLLIWLIHFIF